jgi:predicted nucleic acid-binding protein
MGLIDELGTGPVGLDTPPFIYLIEEHREYLPIVRPVFAAMSEGTLIGVASALVLMETLVQPYRAGMAPVAEQYEAILTRGRGLRLHEITNVVLRSAAQLRASHNVRTPDAIHLATALIARCPVYLTNDRKLPPIAGIRILQVKNYADHA